MGSEMCIRDSSGIKNSVIWPHTRLEASFSGVGKSYDSLTQALLTAGELAIIRDPETTPEEVAIRSQLLQLVSYYSTIYVWDSCREFHAAVLSAAERNKLGTWSNIDVHNIAATTIQVSGQKLPTVQSAYNRPGQFNRPAFRPQQSGYRFRNQGPNLSLIHI